MDEVLLVVDGGLNGRGDGGGEGSGEVVRGGSVPADHAWVDARVVDELVASIVGDARTRHLRGTHLPTREAVDKLWRLVREVVFPGFFGRRDLTRDNLGLHLTELVARVRLLTEEQVRAVLRYERDAGVEDGVELAGDCVDTSECDRRAREIATRFVAELPEVRRVVSLDVQAAFDGDPAAHHPDETIFCYPGVDAIFTHRVAHVLHGLGVPLLPRIMQEMSHSRTGIDIHPAATIGESFFIDHGGGVVVGETSVIGRGVRIYQGVTLGAKSFETDERGRIVRTGAKRHPTLGDRVIVYAGAVILGGDTVIGDDCVVGGSVFVTESIPAGHMVRQRQPELVVRSRHDMDHTEVAAGG